MEKNREAVFPAEELAQTLEFIVYKDIISVICEKDVLYSRNQLRNMINSFLNKGVE